MMEKDGVALESFESSTFAQPWLCDGSCEVVPELCRHMGSGSGGYSDHVFKYAASELFGIDVAEIDYKCLRFADT